MSLAKETQIVEGIARLLTARGINYEPVEKRDISKIEEHIRAMVRAMLSNQRVWEHVEPKLPEVDRLFFQYDKDEIMAHTAKYFENGIRELKCGNIRIEQQMASLHHNIQVFESIKKNMVQSKCFTQASRFLSWWQRCQIREANTSWV